MTHRRKTSEVPFRRSLQAKVVLGVLAALAVMLLSVMAVVYTRGYELLEARERALASSSAERIASEIGQELALAETLSATLANLGERLPRDEALWRELLPNLLDLHPHRELIAGGGLWPEPGAFTPGVERRSFFWGRDAKGVLQYFDDYNAPDGTGYHREEWYVPARHLGEDRCYWSRSYQDPYTAEPMITCTVAMRRDGRFIGVATVDLRLAGLQDFLSERAAAMQGYAFLLDRNGVFITMPGLPGSATEVRGNPESLAQRVARQPAFAALAGELGVDGARNLDAEGEQLANAIAAATAQIEADEARRIVGQLRAEPGFATEVQQTWLERDPVLGEAALLTRLRFPSLHWQLALLLPERLVREAVLAAVQRVMWALGLSIVLVISVAGWLVRRTLVEPIRRMAQALVAAEAGTEALQLPLRSRDELGLLADKFNAYAEQLADSHAELQASAEQFRAVTELAHDALIQVDEAGCVHSINRAGEAMFGWKETELLGQPLQRLIPWDPRGSTESETAGSRAANRVFELVAQRRDGSEFPAEVSTSYWRGPRHALHNLQLRDISERRRAEEQVRRMATHDSLTGLPNRALFNDRLCQAVEANRRTQRALAVLFLDLDHFKVANDSLGHAVGDALLQAVSTRLQTCIRQADTLARLGGDEFAVLLPKLGEPGEAAMVAQRMLDVLADPFVLEGESLQVGASIGATLCPLDDEDADQLLRKADMAMYHAKAEGRNTFRFYTERLHGELIERKALLDEISRAIAQHEFVLHYQPILDVASGRLHGIEALLRWKHPVRGLVGPDQFIPAAERSGQIVHIGHWVIEQALRDLSWWDALRLPPVTVAINLSLAQFSDPALVQRLRQALQEQRCDPARVELELTESVLMHDLDAAVAIMRHLRELGVGLAVDDFGTGYSSLSYLKRFPVQKLKIDKSFVSGAAQEADTASICRSVIALGHNLGLRLVGEGVETEADRDFLAAHGCDYMQGYLFSRPRAMEDLQAWARQR